MLSIITPAFNEAANLEAMRARLTAALAARRATTGSGSWWTITPPTAPSA
jgi:hypothetical protein